ncbi:IucA/IucC family protein [Shewanella sp. OMA3-2]|uniref:IucA/IucC family protein n=1 Tax=Shewanella sp. OMA3-2 TaxID=2908650 RepID=UPI001F22A461|nr:IucA/IucC family protein [Shewanella sp. OMA3-2]UJF22082.1 hypothetical protein L0B17_01045 [Shewanella sp. OMA3-2]
MLTSEEYISQRIIDACLRENVCDLMTKGEVIAALPAALSVHWPNVKPQAWLKVSHLSHRVMYVPIAASHYMQTWRAISYAWISNVPKDKDNTVFYQQGYQAWLTELASCLPAENNSLFMNYIQEAHCAVSHRELCKQAFEQQKKALSTPLCEQKNWHQNMLFSDQVASYLDHPYYPTARAKVGFDAEALKLYAPEFAAYFELNWLAIPKELATITSAVPDCWPSMAEVGLDELLHHSHNLFPLHPLTTVSLGVLPEGVILAPKSAVSVQASLSVRTLAVVKAPGIHIKVPLLMATLGAKNIRSIKPSTLYDGHWFERALTALAQRDEILGARMQHVDEQHGGHLGDNKLFAYIVRRYPLSMQNKQLVPVAALASPMPDGRLYLVHLADKYYQGQWDVWLNEYIDLMLKVHLRLWLKYGIALESNQQNAILAYQQDSGLSLVMKDNDSARLLAKRYEASLPKSELINNSVAKLIDRRMLVNDDEALAQMFTTITLQLDIAAIIEAIAGAGMASAQQLYQQLRHSIINELELLQQEGINTRYAHHYLLTQAKLPVKYLLCSGSLLSKTESGASDVNKFYGHSAPNFLLTSLDKFELEQQCDDKVTQAEVVA